MPDISLRELNRTLLQRQLLLDRVSMPAADLVRHLIAVQGQEPNWPYVGLWARLTDFRHEDLIALLQERSVVRGTTVRRTVHLTDAQDFRWLRPTVRPMLEQTARLAYFGDVVAGLDLGAFAAAGRELLTGRTLSRRELGRALVERFPDRAPGKLNHLLGVLVPMLHDADAGRWGRWRTRYVSVSLAEEWIGAPLADSPQPETLVLRYLAAYGPATAADVQAFSGVTRLAEVIARLRPRLRVYRDETGRELFDLADAVLADPDLPAPVRFLPAFDNSLLGHRDRSRIFSDEDRARIAKEASAGVPMYLVDGFVHGRWALDGNTVRITPWHPLSPADEDAVRAEADSLFPVITPGEDGKVVIERR
ncbi:winged helix DNA-binding domain-containing protein [Nocardia jejuensis]|uniref:winged helix DNA-binding domain-containing protein n=1 Tax=Nocardia jejuensis TaxID=328049 RepID=UPI000834000A|nr:winged helix DNA-binding domain-containing protein [Nocardia jejuensis]